jgi:uncharacterized membrane protein YidH (DUF202 family)
MMNSMIKLWLVRAGSILLMICFILPFLVIPELSPNPSASVSLVRLIILEREFLLVFFPLGVLCTLIFSFMTGSMDGSPSSGKRNVFFYYAQIIAITVSLVSLLLGLWDYNRQFQQVSDGLYHLLPAVGTIPLVIGYLLVIVGLIFQISDLRKSPEPTIAESAGAEVVYQQNISNSERISPQLAEIPPIPVSPPAISPPVEPIQFVLPKEDNPPPENILPQEKPLSPVSPSVELLAEPQIESQPEPEDQSFAPTLPKINPSPGAVTSGPRLELTSGSLEQQVFPLSGEDMIIGRGLDCDLIIPDRKVARHHARIYLDGERWFIQDQQSESGTWVNSQTIQTCALNSSDEITIGEQTFRFYEN